MFDRLCIGILVPLTIAAALYVPLAFLDMVRYSPALLPTVGSPAPTGSLGPWKPRDRSALHYVSMGALIAISIVAQLAANPAHPRGPQAQEVADSAGKCRGRTCPVPLSDRLRGR
jgi:hypothetical protein